MNQAKRLMQHERELSCFTHNGCYTKPVDPRRIDNPHADKDAQIDLVVRMTGGNQFMPREFKPDTPAVAGQVSRTL